MKKTFSLLIACSGLLVLNALLFIGNVHAQDEVALLYVSDQFEVPVRQTGCSNCTIVHYGLASGTEVIDLGEQVDDWTLIRTQGGIEGWMPSRFLLDEPVAREQLITADESLALLQEENLLFNQQLESLLNELYSMGLSVESTIQESEDGLSSVPVMQISGDIIGLNSQNDELIRRNQFLQQEVDILTARNERLEDSSWRTWFIYGAGAVLAGAVLSILLPKLTPRKRYSEWG